MLVVEEATDGESFIDRRHERKVPKVQSTGELDSKNVLNRFSKNPNKQRGVNKPSLANSKSLSKLSSNSSKSSSTFLPRLVNKNDSNGVDVPRLSRNRLSEEPLPDVADDDCPICRSERERNENTNRQKETNNKSISFVVPLEPQNKGQDPKFSGKTPAKKAESIPVLSPKSPEQTSSNRAKTPARPKSRFAAPSSLAAPCVTAVDVREPKQKPEDAAKEHDEVETRDQIQPAEVSKLEPVEAPKEPAQPVVNSVPTSMMTRHKEIVNVTRSSLTPIRRTVIPEPAKTKSIEPRPTIVIPPRLLAGLSPHVSAGPIDSDLAVRLKQIVFGSCFRKPTDAWRLQSLAFAAENGPSSAAPRFVVIQRPNTGAGTTGAMAVVQAELLKQILYREDKIATSVFHKPEAKQQDPFHTLRLLTRSQRTDALVAALTEIICRATTSPKHPFSKTKESAAQEYVANVVIPCGRRVLPVDGTIADDGITEKLLLFTFPMNSPAALHKELKAFFRQNMVHFDTDGSGGVLLCLYSAVLSRGIDDVIADIDESSSNSLITPDAYTSTEAINLLLTGVASSFFFNDDIYLETNSPLSSSTSSLSSIIASAPNDISDSSGATSFDDASPLMSNRRTVRHLRGIHARSDIGVLTISEYYASEGIDDKNGADSSARKEIFEQMQLNKVGSYLKTPRYPIWIAGVGANSTKFAVLYSTNIELISNWRAERLFDLFCLDAWSATVDKTKATASVSLAHCLQPIRIRMDAIDRPDLTNTTASFQIESSGESDSEIDDIGYFGTAPTKRTQPPIELVLQTKWPGAHIDYLSLPM